MGRKQAAGTLPVLFLILGMIAGCAAGEDPSAPSGDAPPQEATSAAPRSPAQQLDDARMVAEIQLALLDTTALRRYDFVVTAEQGRVALRGTVATAAERRLAETLARNVEGVQALTNELVVPEDTLRADTSLAAPRDSVARLKD